jgi:hypothetical protein
MTWSSGDSSKFFSDLAHAEFISRATFPEWLSPQMALRNWGELVGQVEAGYDLPDYEYFNDVAIRDLLESILNAVSERLRVQLAALIAPLDERFVQATRPVATPIFGDPEEDRFWWRRVPITMGAALRRDLARYDEQVDDS